MNNIILHIPHSSLDIPIYSGYLKPEGRLIEEMNLFTDWFTEELFNLPYKQMITPFSRIFCDVERFADDSQEVMSQHGMGMCYTHFDSGEPMRNVSPELRSRIKTGFYDIHHKSLEESVSEVLKEHEQVLIIDCHSFPDKPFKRDLIPGYSRPDFCIGSDEYHTSRELVAASLVFLKSKGFDAKENEPYSGTMIPMKYYRKNSKVLGIMIEVNRKLYMSDSNGEIIKTSNFNKIQRLLAELIAHLSANKY